MIFGMKEKTMTDSIRLQDMTWKEVERIIETSGKTIILPFGSTEQHGPHLPVGTDTMVAATRIGSSWTGPLTIPMMIRNYTVWIRPFPPTPCAMCLPAPRK